MSVVLFVLPSPLCRGIHRLPAAFCVTKVRCLKRRSGLPDNLEKLFRQTSIVLGITDSPAVLQAVFDGYLMR